jgi:glycosyl transferase family 25
MTRAGYKIFVINLDASLSRMGECQNQLSDYHFERISAVDGSQLEHHELTQFYDVALNRQQYHSLLTLGEIGCYLSHRKVWQKIVDEQLDFALVLEDDFINNTDISMLMHDVAEIKQPWHCIKLAEFPIKRKVVLSESLGAANLGIYNKIPSKTCAQIISLVGAKQLLAMSDKFGRPVDMDIQHWWENDLRVFGLQPYPFEINQSVDSDIENKGARKESKRRRIFKFYKQVLFYFRNRQQTAILLSKKSLNFRNNSFKVIKTMNR